MVAPRIRGSLLLLMFMFVLYSKKSIVAIIFSQLQARLLDSLGDFLFSLHMAKNALSRIAREPLAQTGENQA